MNKNWYVIYTKPMQEKKVIQSFTKKKVECFFPQNLISSIGEAKIVQEPLLPSLVFVKATLEELLILIEKTAAAISIMHWQEKPACINPAEIIAMKNFTAQYRNIAVHQCPVNSSASSAEGETIATIHNTDSDGNIKTATLILPNLGVKLIAQIGGTTIFKSDLVLGAIATNQPKL